MSPDPSPIQAPTVTRTDGKPILCVFVAAGAVFLDWLVVPAFAKATGEFSNSGVPGLITAVVGAIASSWAFLQCPGRFSILKLLTFVLMVLGLLFGIYELLAYYKYFIWGLI